MERKNFSNNNIKQLKRENGTYTTSNMEILKEQYDYYQKLYGSDSIAEDHIKTYLRDTDNLNILNEQESKQLEGEITEYECKLTIEKNETKQISRI